MVQFFCGTEIILFIFKIWRFFKKVKNHPPTLVKTFGGLVLNHTKVVPNHARFGHFMGIRGM
jgi:hypothetical protein